MFRGMGEKLAVAGFALLAAGVFGGTASAADLGGGCCGDLEERVAELEATTARKGNRVVSLQISGSVNQALLVWDDGIDSDAYVVTPTGSSVFRFRGEGKISEEMKAGYYMEIAVYGEGAFLVNQVNDEAFDPANPASAAFSDSVSLQHNALYLDHAKVGRLWIGQTSGATDNITVINPANSVGIRNMGTQLYMGNFVVRREGSAAVTGGVTESAGYRFRDLFGGDSSQSIGEGHRYDLVKYESPSIAGFTVSASWGEDDYWDAALRYAGLLGGRFKVAAGIGYGNFEDTTTTNAACVGVVAGSTEADCHQLGASGGIMDMGTGLFFHVAYGFRQDDGLEDRFVGFDGDRESLYFQAGIEKNWFGVGATTLFGEYQHVDMGSFFTTAGLSFASAEAEVWGLGVVQKFDAAALDLYATFRNISSESAATIGGPSIDNEDWQEFYAGARIAF
jgi:hypothetical protein